ncbi:MAG: type II toxin-antitoxin system PemK/MazF family toxin [Deltaproteobacteria bacterium]|nr:type II toxin-antitoxin system PemK/MazF family toxin [Deltaproteobacteria bacterium]
MTPKRGEVWLAKLDPTQGSEQAGTRPVLVYQNDIVNRFTTTVVTIPFTTNLRRASVPSCYLVRRGDGGLTSDSVVLCHQIRVLDKARLQRRLGAVEEKTMTAIDSRVLFTLGII